MEHHPPGSEDFGRLSGNAGRILAKLLSATFPGKEEIAQQVATARGRVIDADGSLELSVADAPRADVVERIQLRPRPRTSTG